MIRFNNSRTVKMHHRESLKLSKGSSSYSDLVKGLALRYRILAWALRLFLQLWFYDLSNCYHARVFTKDVSSTDWQWKCPVDRLFLLLVVGHSASVVGLWIFQTVMSQWKFRHVFWVTTFLRILASFFDLIIVKRWNLSVGMNDKWVYLLGGQW